jgi:hypothetical protein
MMDPRHAPAKIQAHDNATTAPGQTNPARCEVKKVREEAG